MSFEEGLSAHLKSRAQEFDVPATELALTAHPPKRQTRSSRVLSTAAATLAVAAFGFLLVSGSATNVAEGELPNLGVQAEISPAPSFSTTTSIEKRLPVLDDFAWTTLPMRGAEFLEFENQVLAITDFHQLAISDDGTGLAPIFDTTLRPWHSWTSDGETIYAIASPANESESWTLYYNDGPVWTQAAVEFPEGTDYVEILGSVGGEVALQYGAGWTTDPRDTNLRRLLADSQAPDNVRFITGKDRIYVVEALSGLKVGTIEYEDTGMTRAELLNEIGPSRILPTGTVAMLTQDGTLKDLNLPFDAPDYPFGVGLKSHTHFGIPSANSLHITDDAQQWEAIPLTFNRITQHDGVLFTDRYEIRPGAFARYVDGAWEEFGPPAELFLGSDRLSFDTFFDVGDLGYASIGYEGTTTFTYVFEFEIDGLTVSGNSSRSSIAIINRGITVEYESCCSDEENWVALREGNLVFSDPATSTEILVIDPITLERELSEAEINSTRTTTLTYSADGQNWFQLPLSDITGSEWITDVLVTDQHLFIATEDEILVGAPK